MNILVACAVVVALGCEGSKPAGGGSAVATGSAVAAGSAAGPAIAACDLDGPYRARFVSNGTDGWWLRFTIDKGAVTFPAAVEMLGLPAGAAAAKLDTKTCGIAITAKTKQAGELAIMLVLDPNANTVAGTVVRTDEYSVKDHTDSTPITGVRDKPRKRPPACIHEGVFEIGVVAKTKWKLSQGTPRFGLGCNMGADEIIHRHVRVEQLGDTLFLDEAEHDDNSQGFSRAKIERTGDCTITASLSVQDFSFDGAKLTFADDTITGTTAKTTWEFFEDGEAGENLWKCSAKQAGMEGKRVAD